MQWLAHRNDSSHCHYACVLHMQPNSVGFLTSHGNDSALSISRGTSDCWQDFEEQTFLNQKVAHKVKLTVALSHTNFHLNVPAGYLEAHVQSRTITFHSDEVTSEYISCLSVSLNMCLIIAAEWDTEQEAPTSPAACRSSKLTSLGWPSKQWPEHQIFVRHSHRWPFKSKFSLKK